jgi:hypothetical protein
MGRWNEDPVDFKIRLARRVRQQLQCVAQYRHVTATDIMREGINREIERFTHVLPPELRDRGKGKQPQQEDLIAANVMPTHSVKE